MTARDWPFVHRVVAVRDDVVTLHGPYPRIASARAIAARLTASGYSVRIETSPARWRLTPS